MNSLYTGIAVGLAIIVVAFFFFFSGFSFFNSSPSTTATSTTTLGATSALTSLQVTDEVVGTGATAALGDTLTVSYVGKLADGTVFDASANHGGTFDFVLGAGQVIPGWDQGLVGMREGGTRLLVIPPSLAYGAQGVGGVIPPNATLTFEVQLVKVQKPK